MEFNKRCISKEEFKKYEDSDVAYALYVRDNLNLMIILGLLMGKYLEA